MGKICLVEIGLTVWPKNILGGKGGGGLSTALNYPEVLFLLNNGVKRTFYDCVPLVLGTKLANGEQ